MAPLLIVLAAGAVLLLFVLVLATASVVARLAVHLRDEAWNRINDSHGALRRTAERLDGPAVHDRCEGCPVRRHPTDLYGG